MNGNTRKYAKRGEASRGTMSSGIHKPFKAPSALSNISPQVVLRHNGKLDSSPLSQVRSSKFQAEVNNLISTGFPQKPLTNTISVLELNLQVFRDEHAKINAATDKLEGRGLRVEMQSHGEVDDHSSVLSRNSPANIVSVLEVNLQVLREKNVKLDAEIEKLEGKGLRVEGVREFIDLLHEYNSLKDIAQELFGRLANMRMCLIRDIYQEMRLSLAD